MSKVQVSVVRCVGKTHRCPECGKLGRRKRLLCRRVRSLAYRQECYVDVHYAEYQARCDCCEYFRSWPLSSPAKCDYDDLVRWAVLDRLLEDGLNVQRTIVSMNRDFLLDLSEGFVYDCLRWASAQLDLAIYRQLVIERFSGTLCIDELHLGRFTLVLCTDPLADMVVAFALVSRNDKAHMRRFLANLKAWGLLPRVVVTDGSNLYPKVLAQLWPEMLHQLCVFHILKDINALVIKAARRMAGAMSRRGNCGRKAKPGRPTKTQAERGNGEPTLKDQASFIRKHRFLLVKNCKGLDEQSHEILKQMFDYMPELRTLWCFAREVRKLFDKTARVQTLWLRRTLLLREQEYQQVPELVEAMQALDAEKFAKAVAFVYSPNAEKVRTNNHVERVNRQFRFCEKLRYKWRTRKSLVRFVVLLLDRWSTLETQVD